MSKTIYVVSERSFEYNDEYYHLPYDGSGENSGKAQFAFSTKEQAIELRNKKNLQWLRTTDLGQFGEDGIGSLSYRNSKKLEFIFDALNINHAEYEVNIPSEISDEKCNEILSLIDIAPWIVSEVKYEET